MSAAAVGDRGAAMTALPLASCFEFVAYPGRTVDTVRMSAWPAKAGAALRDAAGRPTVLHFAPDRWLVPAPAPPLLQQLQVLERAGCGTLIDVTGKWQELRIAPEDARALLARSIDFEAVLTDRECAAIMLFDCPALLARREDAFNLWIAASFIQSVLALSATLPKVRFSS
jgi:sarcosine oxidase gamma subunit